MTRDEVRVALGARPRSERHEDGDEAVDVFDALGVCVTYDEFEKCAAIELFAPAVPEFNWRALLSVPATHIESWLRHADRDVSRDNEWIVSPRLGLALRRDADQRRHPSGARSVVAFAVGHLAALTEFRLTR